MKREWGREEKERSSASAGVVGVAMMGSMCV